MSPELIKSIMGLTRKMLTMKALQENSDSDQGIGERELMILNLLREKGRTSVSEISTAVPSVSYSTISTDITRLWRHEKLVTKTIDPENQRVTLVELTDKGKKVAEELQNKRDDRMARLYEAMDPTSEEEKVIIRVCDRATHYFDGLLSANGKDLPVK